MIMDEINDYGIEIEGELGLQFGFEMELVESEVVDWPMALSYFAALLPIYCYPVWASSLLIL
jgi:hypothetical protein